LVRREESGRGVGPASAGPRLIGVLAIQGDFEAHRHVLEGLGARVREVRGPTDLEGLAGLVIPGGESTAMTLGIERAELAEPLRALVRSGAPVLGTCAGMIMLDRNHLGVLDVTTERNAFGRQVRSFETELDLAELGAGIGATFIRAPWVSEHGDGVRVLAEVDGHPVAVLQGDVLAVAFHTELDGETRLHEWLLERARSRNGREAG
jgi:5'-phosphate synthase pdxT subunit